MSYTDRYVQGSFRGVKFLTESMTTTFGRRVATYELPFDESGVAHVDLGRCPRKFKIRAILLGEDYDRERNDLIAALEKPGAGLLVHPTLGRFQVIIKDDIQITESTENGGMAEIDFSAVEARDPVPPAGPGSLLDAVRDARDAASDNLLVKLLTEGPDFLTQDLFDTLDSVARDLTILNAQINAWLSVPGNLASRIDRISQQLAELLDTPRKFFDAIDNFFASLMASISRVVDAASQEDLPASVRQSALKRAVLRLADLGSSAPAIPPTNTATRRQQRENRAALLHAMRTSALANAAASLAEIPPASRTEALDLSLTIAREISTLADGDVEGVEVTADMYEALKNLASAVEQLADASGADGTVQLISVPQATPAVVLAYQLYGDSERVEEIIARNPQMVHPGAVPPSERVEVLDR